MDETNPDPAQDDAATRRTEQFRRGQEEARPPTSGAGAQISKAPAPIPTIRGYAAAVPKTWPDVVPDPPSFGAGAADAEAIFGSSLWNNPLQWPHDRRLGGSAWAGVTATPYVFLARAINAVAESAPGGQKLNEARLWAGELIVGARISENLRTRFYLDGHEIDASLGQWRRIQKPDELATILADCGSRTQDGSTSWLFVEREGLDRLIGNARALGGSVAKASADTDEGWRVGPGEDLFPWAVRAEPLAAALITARGEKVTHAAIGEELERMAAKSGVVGRTWTADNIKRALQRNRQTERGARRAPQNAP